MFVLLLVQVFTQLLSVLACTSEREAQNLAITLEILLSDVTRWQVRACRARPAMTLEGSA